VSDSFGKGSLADLAFAQASQNSGFDSGSSSIPVITPEDTACLIATWPIWPSLRCRDLVKTVDIRDGCNCPLRGVLYGTHPFVEHDGEAGFIKSANGYQGEGHTGSMWRSPMPAVVNVLPSAVVILRSTGLYPVNLARSGQ